MQPSNSFQVSEKFKLPEYEIIATNEAKLAVAARIKVGLGSIYLLPIVRSTKNT